MTPLAAGILGALAGAAIVAVVLIRWRATAEPPRPVTTGAANDSLGDVLPHLRTPAALLGGHDEVVTASPITQSSGLVRGARIVVPEALALVRTARADHELTVADIEVPRGGTAAPHQFAVRAVPLSDERVLLLADDRTQALRIDETRRDFVANISHELKTPVGAISLLAEAVEAAADEPEAVRGFAVRLSHQAARLSELVSQVIALSRLQSSEPLLAAERVPLDAVVAAAVERCRPLAEGKQVTVTVNAAAHPATWGDADQLETAVTNLVQNAIAYSDAGARVVVSLRAVADPDDPRVEIAVSDNGIGIAEENQQRVFERFFRVDYGRSRAHGGTGLGLALVKHIAESHGGSVTLWSQPGHGSTFTIRLPQVGEEEDA